jgi:hypothetical protein
MGLSAEAVVLRSRCDACSLQFAMFSEAGNAQRQAK